MSNDPLRFVPSVTRSRHPVFTLLHTMLCTIIPSVRFKSLILQCPGVTIGIYRTQPSENGKVRRTLLDQRRQTRLSKLNDLCSL
jgi:hypothetical protein